MASYHRLFTFLLAVQNKSVITRTIQLRNLENATHNKESSNIASSSPSHRHHILKNVSSAKCPRLENLLRSSSLHLGFYVQHNSVVHDKGDRAEVTVRVATHNTSLLYLHGTCSYDTHNIYDYNYATYCLDRAPSAFQHRVTQLEKENRDLERGLRS